MNQNDYVAIGFSIIMLYLLYLIHKTLMEIEAEKTKEMDDFIDRNK